jgi:DnaK suppressor protein
MDERTLAGFREFLEARLDGLLSGRCGPVSELANIAQVDPMDTADMASSHCDKELLNTFRYRNRQLIDEIRSAIQRINDGEFGICCVCLNSIGLERLKAQPTAMQCIRCQGALENLRRRLSAA